MTYTEATLNDKLLEALISLSEEWEKEDNCYGYRKNEKADIEDKRIFIAADGDEVIGYIFTSDMVAKNIGSIIPNGTPYIEIDELYVRSDRRNRGIGSELFRFAEGILKSEGAQYLRLSTATKDYKAILHFYIDEVGMDFWSAGLFKKL